MRPLSILLLVVPLPAFAQTAPTTHDEAQRIVRAAAADFLTDLCTNKGDGAD